MSSKKTTGTKKDGKPALVPKLRFPEFRDAEGWEPATLGEKSSILKGKGISKADLDPNGSQACIRYGELYTRYGETVREAASRTKVPASELFLSKPDDVIIPSSGETKIDIAKASCVLLGGIALGGDLNVIRSKLNGTFLSYYLNGPKRLDIAKVAQGDTVVHLYPHQLEALNIAVPTPAEQQKIAECLSSVDEVIATQARKVDALKTHKKGLMQQLFPREGETQPRLRFPEFQNAGEWKVRPLGELVELQSGFAFSSSNFGSEGRKLVTPKNFTKHGHGNFDETVSKYTTEDVPERFVCKPGDLLVLLTDLTPTCELLGKPLLLEDKDGTVLLNQRVVRVKPSASELEILFLKYVFLSEPYNKRIIKTATGSTVKHSSNKVLQEMPLFQPALPEQQRIATCLSSLDALITAETQKLEALKRHKRGLMQQLFPSPEEAEV